MPVSTEYRCATRTTTSCGLFRNRGTIPQRRAGPMRHRGEADMELEQATRQMRIDPRLKAAGWAVTPFDPAMPKAIPSQKAVEEWPTTAGPADYALCDEHSVRAVVEAKKQSTGAQGILPKLSGTPVRLESTSPGRANTVSRSYMPQMVKRLGSMTFASPEPLTQGCNVPHPQCAAGATRA